MIQGSNKSLEALAPGYKPHTVRITQDVHDVHMWEIAQNKITATEMIDQSELEAMRRFDLLRWLGWTPWHSEEFE